MLSKISPFRTRTKEEGFTYIPFALLALWFAAFLFHAISSAPVFSTLASLSTTTNNKANPNPILNSTHKECQYQSEPQHQQTSILNLTTLLFLGLFTSLTFLLSFIHLLLHLQSLHPNRNFGAIAFYLFAFAGLICFGITVFDENVGFSVYVESIVWPGLAVMSAFVVVLVIVEMIMYIEEKEKENRGGEVDGDESEVVVEEELEGKLDEMEIDLERGTTETEGDGECEEGCEVVGEDEPMIRKGKEKEVDIEKGEREQVDSEDCGDADFVEIPRK